MTYKNKIIFMSFILLAILNVFLPVVYAIPDFAVVEKNNVKVSDSPVYKTAESSLKTSATPVFSFKSQSQILMEATTGKIIYANNENDRLLPASVTKIMTLLLIMEQIDSGNLRYTDTVTCSTAASKMGGSQIWFKEGETLTVDEALKCICVVSANDVSYAMAELVGGSHENFVNMMNEKAKQLGMSNTHFLNAHGIDEEGHYTTAKDIALMSRELIAKHPDIIKYTTIWMDTIRNGAFGLSSTNKLLKSYKGITGLKTGSTSKAMFNLSATANRDGLSLIAVVMKAPSSAIRNEEITSLLNYGFSSYTSKLLCKKGDVIKKTNINKNITDTCDIVYEQDEYLIGKKGDNLDYESKVEFTNVIAPLKKGTVVGKVKFIDENGETIREANIVTSHDMKKSNLLEYMKYILKIYAIRQLKNVA